jgi:hypothetical protein
MVVKNACLLYIVTYYKSDLAQWYHDFLACKKSGLNPLLLHKKAICKGFDSCWVLILHLLLSDRAIDCRYLDFFLCFGGDAAAAVNFY